MSRDNFDYPGLLWALSNLAWHISRDGAAKIFSFFFFHNRFLSFSSQLQLARVTKSSFEKEDKAGRADGEQQQQKVK